MQLACAYTDLHACNYASMNLQGHMHALDLYLVCMSRTHFKQSTGESLIPQFLQVKVLNLLSQKSKLKTKTGLMEEGNIIIKDTVTRYAVI